MSKRKIIAALALAGVLAFPLASAALAGGPATGPQWSYFLGMSGEEALVVAVGGAVMCSLLPAIGSAACGITGAL